MTKNLFLQPTMSLEREINWKFLHAFVEVVADGLTVKGRLERIERSIKSDGLLGNLLLENDGRKTLIVGRNVVVVRR